MARSLNKVMLIGNLGADPEVRSTANGTRVANLSVATSRQWNNPAGERQEKTEWHRIVAWNNRVSKLADFVEKYLKKGDRVYVEGRIEYRTWEDREGNTRYSTEINARELIPLSSRGGPGGAEAEAQAPAPARAAQAVAAESKSQSYEDFPEALDEEDDDLPF
ncbi:MAG: single-stranded DNA-binding protein [Gemmatimonadetes bacterium]|nr:single-stranded DNA-binding protein [Gemmatimonadota bacterium]MBI2402759.1 single-stranded DNA-binding protein [Gemmatimonadota bacterium]MBI2615851.1 single-stranded DNA-binding protein [Gemmatimonadota bacterium]